METKTVILMLISYVSILAVLIGYNIYRLAKLAHRHKSLNANQLEKAPKLSEKAKYFQKHGHCSQHTWVDNKDPQGKHYLKCLICRKEPGELN